jgi:hypothetical protein
MNKRLYPLFFLLLNYYSVSEQKSIPITIGPYSKIFHYYKNKAILFKDSLYKFAPISYKMSGDTFSFVGEGKGAHLLRTEIFTKQDSSIGTNIIDFENYPFNKRDQPKYLPAKILDFEYKSVYINYEESDISRLCFYINPKNNDILEIVHDYYIGNPTCIFLYTNDSINPFKGNATMLYDLLALNKPLENTNYIGVKMKLVNGKWVAETEESSSIDTASKKRVPNKQ